MRGHRVRRQGSALLSSVMTISDRPAVWNERPRRISKGGSPRLVGWASFLSCSSIRYAGERVPRRRPQIHEGLVETTFVGCHGSRLVTHEPVRLETWTSDEMPTVWGEMSRAPVRGGSGVGSAFLIRVTASSASISGAYSPVADRRAHYEASPWLTSGALLKGGAPSHRVSPTWSAMSPGSPAQERESARLLVSASEPPAVRPYWRGAPVRWGRVNGGGHPGRPSRPGALSGHAWGIARGKR